MPAPDWLVVGDAAISIAVHVQPGSKRTEVAGLHGSALKVRLAAPPVDGRANDELIRFLAELLGVPRKGIALLRGSSARDKVVRISGVAPEHARHLLSPRGPTPGR